ncbi:MAG: hypothetical protein COY46_01275 [Chloroflexi bacterium CG_4_10_14_0_8_um_filter_46_9]|nr:MAG: hypothetical protein COY46_01275 [Chloroflexi bacterium CG_4_10_14_0_8_um_filter_46_9]
MLLLPLLLQTVLILALLLLLLLALLLQINYLLMPFWKNLFAKKILVIPPARSRPRLARHPVFVLMLPSRGM